MCREASRLLYPRRKTLADHTYSTNGQPNCKANSSADDDAADQSAWLMNGLSTERHPIAHKRSAESIEFVGNLAKTRHQGGG
jgi:hypothetical protein